MKCANCIYVGMFSTKGRVIAYCGLYGIPLINPYEDCACEDGTTTKNNKESEEDK